MKKATDCQGLVRRCHKTVQGFHVEARGEKRFHGIVTFKLTHEYGEESLLYIGLPGAIDVLILVAIVFESFCF